MSRVWSLINYLTCVRHFDLSSSGRVRAFGRLRIERPRLVKIAGSIYFGPNLTIMNRGVVSFGRNVIVGPNVTFIDYNHNYKSDSFLPYSADNVVRNVVIGDHVWIGFGAIVLPGVSIGEGAIVGAGAVVKDSVPPCMIVAGNPAKVVGARDLDRFERLKDNPDSFYLDLAR